MIYEIAGLKVEMNPKFDRLKRQSEAYKSLGEPVIRINPDFDGGLYALPDNCTAEDREYIYSSAAFCREIIPHGRFFLHASAVVLDGEAYLFSAPSGMGKSTHTALWLRQFKGSYILNDDKPVIFPENEGVTVWGTPFAGKTDLQVNLGVPLRAVCFLKQGNENSITRIDSERAIALTLNNTYRPKNAEEMNLLLDMIEKVVERADIFEMSCRNEFAAAKMSYNAMKGKGF
ncbi:MAG: hypothetical protein ACI4FN_08240 [Acutalibacteraceae bacterium]